MNSERTFLPQFEYPDHRRLRFKFRPRRKDPMFDYPRYRPPGNKLRRKLFPQRFPKIKNCLPLLASGIILLAVSVLIRRNLVPVLQTMSEHRARLICTQLVNEVVARQLEKTDSASISNFVQKADGTILAANMDTAAANRLKSDISLGIIDELEQYSIDGIQIPLGTLLQGPLLNGYGPSVPLRIIPSQSVAVDFSSHFTSAGINQTRHQILLIVILDADVIIPGIRSQIHVTTSFLVTETLLIGSVPEAYTEVYTNEEESLPNLIVDYGVK